MTDKLEEEEAPPRPRPGIDWPRLALWGGLIALAGPAVWNGFPIVFFDTGGYINRALDGTLEAGRSLFYGLFLQASSLGWLSFWGTVLLQCGACLWLIHLLLRCHDIGPHTWPPRARAGAAALLLSVLTGIGWYSGQLMPDIWVALLVPSLWLLGFRGYALDVRERAGLALVALLALLSHMGAMALGLGLVLVTAIARLLGPRLGLAVPVRLLPPAAIVAAGLILMPLAHLLLVGQATYTPGGATFITGRLIQDGLLQDYLARHCPDPAGSAQAPYRLCAYQERIPNTANDFIWHKDSPFKAIGGWGAAAQTELGTLSRAIIRDDPLRFLTTGLTATGEQLLRVHSGDGLREWQELTRHVFAQRLPDTVNLDFLMARQQQGTIPAGLFAALNAVHVPVAHLSLLGLGLVVIWGLRRGQSDLAALALFTLLALLGNAFISGALSNPHDRYQSRMAWLATLVVAMAVTRWWEGRRPRP